MTLEIVFANFVQCIHEPCSKRYPLIFFVKESKVELCDEASKFLTFNALLLFKPCQCVLDLNGRIGKRLGFFKYPKFPNTKIFKSGILGLVATEIAWPLMV